jgi:hypothetical protein
MQVPCHSHHRAALAAPHAHLDDTELVNVLQLADICDLDARLQGSSNTAAHTRNHQQWCSFRGSAQVAPDAVAAAAHVVTPPFHAIIQSPTELK